MGAVAVALLAALLLVPIGAVPAAAASAPQAGFSWTPYEPTTAETVQFLDASTDGDGDIVSWSWSFGDKTTSGEREPGHRFAAAGAYSVRLNVTDSLGAWSWVEYTVQVSAASPGTSPPRAGFNWYPSSPKAGDQVRFVDLSWDEDGSVVSSSWEFGDGTKSAEREPTHAYSEPGTYEVVHHVQDDDGLRDRTSRFVTVSATATAGRAPIVDFTWSPTYPAPGETVKFQDLSKDEDGTIAASYWDFGDGSIGRGLEATHAYASAGSFRVVHGVEDDDGNMQMAERFVSVRAGTTSPEATGRLQALIDAAPPGSTVRVPPGTYFEHVLISKPLRVFADGGVLIDGGAEPAVRILDAEVTVAGLTVRSKGPPLVATGAPSLTVRDVGFDFVPGIADDVGWVHIINPAKGNVTPFELRGGSSMVHLHPLKVTLVAGDGGPLGDRLVRVYDGDRLVREVRSDGDGRLPVLDVAHEWSSAAASGENRTVAVAEGVEAPFLLDPHAGAQRLATGAHAPPGLPPLPGLPSGPVAMAAAVAGLTATVGGLAAALSFRFHEGFRWKWLTMFAPLYTRLAKSELLQHGTREAIHDYVGRKPGAHLRQIKRDLGLQHGTLLHHLQMLEGQGYLRSVRDGMYRRYYVAGAVVPEPTAPRSLTEEIEAYIRGHPGTTNAEVATALSRRPNLVHYHVERLATDGKLRREKVGREVKLFPGDARAPSTAEAGEGDTATAP